MMKTATLTFHASHNYGSMLQAYALQQVMTEIFGENTIINFRSPAQKRMMQVITFRPKLGPILKDLTHLLYYPALKAKYNLFELFIKECLNVGEEYQELKKDILENYDLICCGSDQIWNPGPEDFSINYLLPFPVKGKKISYAASIGPNANVTDKATSFKQLLNGFEKISVREAGTKNAIELLTGRDDIIVNCDPVLLLNKEDWIKLIDNEPIIKGEYIFLYTLYANPFIINCAKAVSKRLGLPVVISNFTNIYDLFSPFNKYLRVGPREFLNLIYNARAIVTSSFHGTAFSILLNKPFAVFNGLNDNRISNLLKITGLESRSIDSIEAADSIDWNVDFCDSNKAIDAEKAKGISYLESCKITQ